MVSKIKAAFEPEAFRKSGHQLVDLLADRLRQTMQQKNEKVLDWVPPEKAYQEIRAVADGGEHLNRAVTRFFSSR